MIVAINACKDFVTYVAFSVMVVLMNAVIVVAPNVVNVANVIAAILIIVLGSDAYCSICTKD